MSAWTQTESEQARSLFTTYGMSFEDISKRFGVDEYGNRKRSRASVSSHINTKLGLKRGTTKPPPLRKPKSAQAKPDDAQIHRAPASIMAPPLPAITEPVPDISESDTPESVRLLDLGTRDCKWPIGDDPKDDPDFGFCGKPQFMGVRGHRVFGRSCYCLKHHRKSMRKEWQVQFDKALARFGEVPG